MPDTRCLSDDGVKATEHHHPAHGREPNAEIEFSTKAVGDERVAIGIRDQGLGIAADDLSKVFDPYFTTKRTGSGLGLAIAKNVVEGLGGTITVESRVGQGTEMRIELPREQPGGETMQ